MHTREEKLEAFGRLLDVMDRLREECPWDRKQTYQSLRTNTIEEVYELSDALQTLQLDEVKKELGDVLLHIVFYSRIAQEGQSFDIADVCHSLCDKLIYRHPHIYGEVQAENADEVLKNWEQIKRTEGGQKRGTLSGVPTSLPSLIKAYRIQQKASGVGFDWSDAMGALDKVEEEIAEVRQALEQGQPEEVQGEMGDLLFALTNLSRLLKVNPDDALEATNRKFISRFAFIEQRAEAMGRELTQMTLEEMDALWEQAKRAERTTDQA